MKKQFIIAAAILGTLAVSCNTQGPEEAVSFRPEFEEFFATTESAADPETKTLADDQYHVLWHADDRVSIFNKYTYNQEYAFTGETGANAGGFRKASTDEFITGSEIDNIYAVYPYQQGTRISTDGTLTVNLPAEQMWADKSFGRGANTMIAVTTDNRITFKNAGGILILKLYGSNTQVQSVTLRGNSGEKLAGKAAVTMPVGSVPSVQMQPDATGSITLTCESPVTLGGSRSDYTEFWFVVPPTEFTNGFTITVTSTDGGTFEKSTDKSISISRNDVSKMAPIEVVPEKPAAEPEWVDLGLSVKWATFNVGASKPEEYGDYFAWGETEPKSNYDWPTYKWCNGSFYPQTKYNTNSRYGTVDNKAVLDPEDDAAHVNWGGSWRMPTNEEWTELRTECTWTWTSQNGVNGRKVIGPNGNSIFLPAAGSRYDTDLVGAGSRGRYLSSSLTTDYPSYAYYVYFGSDNVYRYSYYRFDGQSVRPVEGAVIPVTSIMMPSSLDLVVGRTETLSATISPGNATYKGLTWSSSDESVATVDATGKVTAVATGKATITAYSADASKTAACEVTVKIQATGITIEPTSVTLAEGKSIQLSATVSPATADESVEWASLDSNVAIVDADGLVTAKNEGVTRIFVRAKESPENQAFCEVTVIIDLSLPTTVEAVDLGLPSSLKWATMNVGASKPEEYGEYFAWGETEPKKEYSWLNYKFELGTDWQGPFSKYVTSSSYGTVDNKTVLDPEDDAAHVNWGGSWRMPTKEEQDELINKCTWTWTTQNGVKGSLFTGPNGKSIFLPAAGSRGGTYLNYAESHGNYWSSSSSLDTGYPNGACGVGFHSGGVRRYDSYYRYSGLSVRPVTE